LALFASFTSVQPPLLNRAELSTEADCWRHSGPIVTFEGWVQDIVGVGDLYRVVLTGNNHGRQWQALLPRDERVRYNRGDWISLAGLLTLHEAEGEFFATIHVPATVRRDHLKRIRRCPCKLCEARR
jgi:hypothetical protein